jgi:hypothetical protein
MVILQYVDPCWELFLHTDDNHTDGDLPTCPVANARMAKMILPNDERTDGEQTQVSKVVKDVLALWPPHGRRRYTCGGRAACCR